jgi:transposase
VPRTRPAYPPEFRREAIQLMRSSGRPLRELSTNLGVSEQTLRHWRKQAEIDQGHAEGLTSAERDELRRLQRENRVLREEREVLRKAAAFFAQESERR